MKLNILYILIINIFIVEISKSNTYPSTELKLHTTSITLLELINNVKNEKQDSIDDFIQRIILILDHIESNGPKYQLYISAFDNNAKPLILELSKKEKSTIKLALYKSFLFRFNVYKNRNNVVTHNNSEYAGLSKDEICKNVSGVLMDYCKKNSSFIYTTTNVSGGGSTFRDTIDLYLRTLDFSKFKSNDEITKVMLNNSIPKSEIESFIKTYDFSNLDSTFYNDFKSKQESIIVNPKFYIKNNFIESEPFEKNEILKNIESSSYLNIE